MEVRSNQESRLLDYVQRLERHADGRAVLHVHYSRLKPGNRQERQLRMAAATFSGAVKRYDAYLFNLENSDQVLIVKGAREADLRDEIDKISKLFAGDPLFSDPAAEGLFSWYDLTDEFHEFLSVAREMKEAVDQRRQTEQERLASGGAWRRQPRLSRIEPDNLGRLVEQLASMDISSLLRRQPICALTADGQLRPVFNELFVSIMDLRKTVMPTVDLAASLPLFSYLTQYLDRRILRAMPDMEASIPLSTSININIETVLSPQFLEFDQRLRAVTRKTIVLELQPADLFSDFAGFAFARDFVRDRGYRVCLDGVNQLTLPLIDKKMLKVDLQKLVWTSDGWDDNELQRAEFAAAVRRVGPTRIVLCRCDDPRAIEFGQSLGINLFQGRHIDRLLAEANHNARVA